MKFYHSIIKIIIWFYVQKFIKSIYTFNRCKFQYNEYVVLQNWSHTNKIRVLISLNLKSIMYQNEYKNN